ncbi:hypothetical protein [Eggerthella sinensis]|uniref:Uncharacterized protein n=1 Tax=Eggerthella sinensis TaxID=242230 RepID=A0A3N0ITB5_9ACTN|nr:hypothetical protein [Eggerthella sinensis]RDB66876.1 hypothetical protein C1876_13695 [Eggerthella sinensis]RNM40223.1 hypothetical protein DMP09_15260 [Eggerthella sinensis]
MTIITRTLATLLATVVIAFGSLAGCTAQGDNLMPCALDPSNAARFYGEVRALADTDFSQAIAVEVDGVFYQAFAR